VHHEIRMFELDSLVGGYSHLKDLPREKEALHTLKKIASLVKPIMRARGWRVGELSEFFPNEQNLLGKCKKKKEEKKGRRNPALSHSLLPPFRH
jgi:hypothetical protein